MLAKNASRLMLRDEYEEPIEELRDARDFLLRIGVMP